MQPTDTPDCNFTYAPPPGQEETVGSLRVRKDNDPQSGATEVHAYFTASEDERVALAAGAHVELGIFGLHPISPVSIAVTPPWCPGCEITLTLVHNDFGPVYLCERCGKSLAELEREREKEPEG